MRVTPLKHWDAFLHVQWRPVVHLGEWGAYAALCTCDKRLTEPHNDPICPYVDPDDWYAAEVARMAERAPA